MDLSMEDIRLFIKNNSKETLKMAIKYEDDGTYYKYKFTTYNIIFKETDEKIYMIIKDKTYDDPIDIQLFLYNLFDYKNFEYIDIFLQKQISKTPIYIEDLYNDYYDDFNNEFIGVRNLVYKDINYKLKIVLKENDFHLYYNYEVISGFDDILEKIKEIIQSIMNSNQSS